MKKIIFTILVLSNIMFCKAQIKFSSGVTYLYGQSSKYIDGTGNKGSITLYGITGWVKKFLSPESKITVGVPLSAMLNGSINNQTGSSLIFGIDLPITAEYNFGLGSSEASDSEEDAKFGGFIGGGLSYTYSSVNNSWSIPGTIVVDEQIKGSSYGPLVHGGIRFNLNGKNFTVRAMYKIGLEKAKFSTFGGSLIYGL